MQKIHFCCQVVEYLVVLYPYITKRLDWQLQRDIRLQQSKLKVDLTLSVPLAEVFLDASADNATAKMDGPH